RNTSTWLKISILRRFFKLYDADPTDLTFYLRDETDTDEDELEGTRYELRKKYWTFALRIIQDAFGGEGPFSTANPCKENWVNGYFGIGGFYLCCVANYDSARVEVYLGKSKKEENKKVFDSLKTHQNEIESALGMHLIWVRGDDIKSSKIYYQLDGVSINHETDWLQMAKFHAEWSRKFYEVIVPFITGV
ncbi:MAG: DUF4268 domain-containing protein, partial [Oscillospiraceae bacterium]|nr:DUF4268 domain-containing protein [Oscillospiraceae bacterium]